MWKLWAGCFVFTAAIFLLQVLPISGIFLMFLMAPYWSVVSINLGFAFMVLDGIAGTLSRWALIFPAIWFGGYAIAAGASHSEALNLANGIQAANAATHLPFDPLRETLFAESDSLKTRTNAFNTEQLIQNYALNTAYHRFNGNPSCPAIQAVELRAFECGQGADIVARDSNGCPTITNLIEAGDGGPWRLLRGVCRAYVPVQSLLPTVTLKRTGVQAVKETLIEAQIETFDLSRSDGQTVQVRAGYVVPFSWIPMPVVGCAAEPEKGWTCFAFFVRDDVILLGAIRNGKHLGAAGAIAGALKLPASSVSARFPERSG